MERKYGHDGVAHITFFDAAAQLSFTWDASRDDDNIEVSHGGGYGEPVVDTLSAFDFDDEWGSAPSLSEHLAKFAEICRAYVERANDHNEIASALRRGYIEGDGEVGLTYDGSPHSPRSVAYDTGRTLRRRQDGIE